MASARDLLSMPPLRRATPLLLVCLSIGVPRPTPAAPECVDYREFAGSVKAVDLDLLGEPAGLAVSGDLVFVTGALQRTGSQTDWGVRVVDFTDRSDPSIANSQRISSTYCPFLGPCTGSPVNGVAAHGGRIYTGVGQSLSVWDFSDPVLPEFVCSIPTGGVVRDIAFGGDYAYAVVDDYGGSGLRVIDLRDPACPVVVNGLGLDQASSVALTPSHAFVISSSQLYVFDLEDPSSPRLLESLSFSETVREVAVGGGYAYVGGSAGVSIVDVRDPRAPQWVRDVETLGFPTALSWRDGLLYVVSGPVQVFDVRDPLSPRVLGNLGAVNATDVAFGSDRIYVADELVGLIAHDERNTTFRPRIGGVEIPDRVRRLSVADGVACLATWRGLQLIDVRDPFSPSLAAKLDTLGAVRDVATVGGLAFVAGSDRLQIVDVSDPYVPQSAGGVSTPGSAMSVEVAGDFAYVGTGYGFLSSLQVVDVIDPQAPEIVREVAMPELVQSIAIEGTLAYAGTGYGFGYSSLQIVDVLSDPYLPPDVLGSISTPGNAALGVDVQGDYAYVATGHDPSTLEVIDVADPSEPRTVGSIPIPGLASEVAVIGDYAYVASGPGVQVVDVSVPSSPHLVGSTASFAFGLAVDGGRLFAAGTGLEIFPVQCPDPTPILLSGFTATVRDRAVELRWSTSFEYLHEGFNLYRSRKLENGYRALNERLIRGSSPYSWLDSTVRASATYYYKLGAVDETGRETLHPPVSASTPAWEIRTRLGAGFPNPFRKETKLRFSLASEQKATLSVHDVSGRRVRVLARETLSGGEHEVSWNGRDEAGRRVAAGTYFVRLEVSDATYVTKTVYLGVAR